MNGVTVSDMGMYVCRVDHDKCSYKTETQRLTMIGKAA